METFAPTLVALAAIYIVLEAFKFMVHICFRRNYTFEIAHTLQDINAKLQTMPFEAVCLCKNCVEGGQNTATKIDVMPPQPVEQATEIHVDA